jgi:hypothetical protein
MSAVGAISTLVWALIVIIIIVVIVVVLFKVINLLFIATQVLAISPSYTESGESVFPSASGVVPIIDANTLPLFYFSFFL